MSVVCFAWSVILVPVRNMQICSTSDGWQVCCHIHKLSENRLSFRDSCVACVRIAPANKCGCGRNMHAFGMLTTFVVVYIPLESRMLRGL